MKLLATLSLALSTLSALVSAQCGPLKMRREWRELSQQERTAFVNAFKTLNTKNAQGISRIDQIAAIHMRHMKVIHGYDL